MTTLLFAIINHLKHMNLTAIGLHYFKGQVIKHQGFTTFGQMSDMSQQVTADSLDLFTGVFGFEKIIEILQRCQCSNREAMFTMRLDIDFVVIVVFIVNLTDDLFEHVLNCHQPGDTAVFIDNHRHMASLHAKFLEQYVKTFAFRYK
jgi:hypothetical protein